MNIIFDLDGTLIDSSPAILSALQSALEQHAIEPRLAMTHKLIGPPLSELLPQLTGLRDEQELDQVAAAFKAIYDTDTYRSSAVFDGINELLQSLSPLAEQVFIATNKRQVPTQKIIDFLGWRHYLTATYSLDSVAGLETKADLLAMILQKYRLDPGNTIYIGDTDSDYRAAKANGLEFIMVEWGYGQLDDADVATAQTVQQLKTFIAQRA